MTDFWLVSFNLDGVTAGPSIRFQRYAKEFLAKGYRLNFVTYKLSDELPDYEEREDYRVHRVKVTSGPFRISRFNSKAILYALRKGSNASVVFSFSVSAFQMPLLPYVALLGAKLYYVNTMADTADMVVGTSWLNRFLNHFAHLMNKVFYQKISGIVASTQHLLSFFQFAYNMPPSKLHQIYNGVNINKFEPVNQEERLLLRSKLRIDPSELVFLFVGLKTERKGLKPLIETWEKFSSGKNDVRLMLVGDEKSGANTAAFQAWWEDKKKQIDEKKYAITDLPGAGNIDEYFKAVDVFVFLSVKEGMPNVLLEAMSAGLPIIVNTFDGFSDDYGQAGKHFLQVTANDEKALLRHLECLYNSPQDRLALGHAARELAAEKFKLQNSIDSYCKLIG